MAKPGNLDARTVENAKPREAPYRLSDGGGLLLDVRPSGAKVWLCRVMVAGKRRDMGLGGYPAVSLKDARQRAAEARRQAAGGDDPIAARAQRQRDLERARGAKDEAEARTFRAVARACIAAEAPGWKNQRTALLWEHSLERWAFPALGNVPVAEIDRAAVRRAIDTVWTTRPATGRKVLRRIGAVLRYAAAHGWRANDNPADVRMLRHAGLPALPGGRKQPSLPWARVPAFMVALDRVDGLGALALRLLVLTALRSNEVRQARWSWLSFDGVPTLTVPGEMMKGKRAADVIAHRVPLSGAALDTLARAYGVANGTTATAAELPKLAALARDALIFPSARRITPLSDMALSAVMRRMNENRPEDAPAPWRDADGREAVPHGFRASFSTWVDDTRPEEREAAERALAHEIGNRVSAAYRRSDLFDRRTRLMEDWAAHVAGEARPATRAMRSG
ncbi:MAG: integrase arm-type DNA-binding domain-containing protein [Alphaproteobacteria bacterium]|nr:integrase arm-type DNA-binding domain-containing protein [Alphaproteobacteria bacterium]